MPFKTRSESMFLKAYRILNTRIELSEEEQRYFQNIEKGYQGELEFDLRTTDLQNDCFILNDLLLEVNHNTFQIDTSIIFQETIILIEVKNFEGDFCYTQEGHIKTKSGYDVKNPLDQLNRCLTLFRQLLQSLGFSLTVEGFVVFINSEFTLYQAPLEKRFIHPTQLNQFIKHLDTRSSHTTSLHKRLAQKLVEMHQIDSNLSKLPPYDYKKIKKGVTCSNCSSFSLVVQGNKITCHTCGCTEAFSSAVLRMVEEIRLLFPNRKITTNEVFEWVGTEVTRKRIARILKRSLKIHGTGQWAYYE